MLILAITTAPPMPAAAYAVLAISLALGAACIVAAAVVFWPVEKE